MSEQILREQLYAAFKNRAMMYYHIFEELRKEVGDDKATEIMRRGIYKRGLDLGARYARYGPADLEGLRNAFLASSADAGKMFQPEVLHFDAEKLDIKMGSCPLKEAWQEAGLSDQDIARMCHIAAAVDDGTFEGAGFQFAAETWQPGQEGCCLLKIRPGK
ncbi:MAG: L-2-amino-thiazoline-4-carboxylic acid hydrolase [Deltaproteobacteria bacterium]|nr:MAG: L-2-amino-thiazoline-4-carboxylic acid hydrolase [Deltaproteobacteria bacterium]